MQAHLDTCELRKCHDICAAPRGLGVAQDAHESGESWLSKESTPVGFEPTQGNSIGLAGRRLDRSAKVSSDYRVRFQCIGLFPREEAP